jgi:hypothetical chaperone protein
MIGIGIDFGTSNSTAAWFDGTQLRYVQLERANQNSSGAVMPTAIHFNRGYEAIVGTAAISQYVEENRARVVQLVAEVIGEAATSLDDKVDRGDKFATEMNRHAIYGPLEDRGLPGRLFQGLKRLLGDERIDRISVFNRPYRLVALITPILLSNRQRIEATLGQKMQRVHLGRPVNFESGTNSASSARSNTLAVTRLTEASQHAEFGQVQFYPEPIAATLSFLWQAQLKQKGIALTVDFGGGTLDLCVVGYDGMHFKVISTGGGALGGDRIDQMIFRHMLFPLLGKGETWSRQVDGRLVETPFPFQEYEEPLLNWAITHTLNQNQYKHKVMTCIADGGPAAIKFERLLDLINYNYSHNCIQAIKKAKAELSSKVETTIDIPELNLAVPFTRTQLNTILSDSMTTLDSMIANVVKDAQLTYTDIDVVIRTGGSSQMTAVEELLERLFPNKVRAHDPFTSVAGGLAIANYFDYRFSTQSSVSP